MKGLMTTMANIGDVSKVEFPNGDIASFKDEKIRSEVYTARGDYDTLDARLDDMSTSSTGTQWFAGTAITGTGTVTATISGAKVGDMYLNTQSSSYASCGYVYKCTATNTWVYQGVIKGPQGSAGSTGPTGPTGPTGSAGYTAKFRFGTEVTGTSTSPTHQSTASALQYDMYINTETLNIYSSNTGTDYWVYEGNLSSSADDDVITDLVDNGRKNVLKFLNYQSNGMSNLPHVVNSDGSLTFNGYTGSSAGTIWVDCTFSEARQMVISGSLTTSGITFRLRTTSNVDVAVDSGSGAVFTPSVSTTYRAVIRFDSNKSYSSVTVKPMICTKTAWDISHTYQPYGPSWQELITKSQVYNRGTAINSGDDLNDYTSFGRFYASTSSIASSLSNCPISTGFVMTVEETFQGGKMQTLVTIESGGSATITYRRSQVYRSNTWSWLSWYKFSGTLVS